MHSTEIRGSWAQEAKEMLRLDYLLELFNNQQARWSRDVHVRKWRALGVKIDLVHQRVLDRDMLVHMQQYIATTLYDMLCPWTCGVVINTIDEHFHECDAVPALELKAKLADVDDEKIQLDLKRLRIESNWHHNRTTAEHLQATSAQAVLTHCPRVFLDPLKIAIEAEFLNM